MEVKMKRQSILGSIVVSGILLTALLVLLENSQTQAVGNPPGRAPRVLVLTDLGDALTDIGKMRAAGWNVKPIRALELELVAQKHPYQGGLSDYDVVWVPAKENYPALRLLMRDGGPIDQFAQKGGVVAVVDITP